MLYDTVKEIINNWDPIGLLPYAPKDEYDKESATICYYIEEMKQKGGIKEQELANMICSIFAINFGEDIFKQSFEKCLEIALKIKEKA